MVPAEPSVAAVAVQDSAGNEAWMLMSAALSRVEPQTFAANVNAISRCCPLVVPGLPPTGAAGVGSLKPSFGPSTLTTVMCAPAAAGVGIATRAAAKSEARACVKVIFMAYSFAPDLGCWDR